MFSHANEKEEQKRPSGSSYYVTAILSVLSIAFLFTSFQGSLWKSKEYALHLGDHGISTEELHVLLQYESLLLGREKPSLGLLLSRVIENKLLSMEADALGIKVSIETAKESLRSHSAFLDESGVFQEKKVQDFLKARGLRVHELVACEQACISRERMLNGMMRHVEAPDGLTDAVKTALSQKRRGRYQRFPFKTTAAIQEPTGKELQALFKAYPVIKPQQRSYGILYLKGKAVTLDKKDLEAAISGVHKERYQKLSSGEIETILRKEKEEEQWNLLCQQVEDALGSGATLPVVAKQLGLNYEVLSSDATGKGLKSVSLPTDKKIRLEILGKVFQSVEGHAPEMIAYAPQEGVFFQLQGIEDRRHLSYAEALPLLRARWTHIQQRNLSLRRAKAFSKGGALGPTSLSIPFSTFGDSATLNVPKVVRDALWTGVIKKKSPLVVYDHKAAYVVVLEEIKEDVKTKHQYHGDIKNVVKTQQKALFLKAFLETLQKLFPLRIHEAGLRKVIGTP